MKKRYFAVFLAVVLLSGCGGRGADSPALSEPTVLETVVETTVPEEPFSYADLRLTDFLFSSGAGAWGTSLTVDGDGNFSGVYRDSEMGDRSEEYPNGTVYSSVFHGQLGQPIRVNAYTYRLPVQVLRYEHVPNGQEIIDGQRHCYTTALGIEGTPELLLYRPDTPMEELPEVFRQWIDPLNQETRLSHWGLYNEAQQGCFVGTSRIQKVREQIQVAEELEKSIAGTLSANSTQADMNLAAQQRYLVWDDALNALWNVLLQTTPPDILERLILQQQSWIYEKEKAMEEAAAEVEGGSLAPLVTADLAATMTKERVYLLLDYLPIGIHNS